MAITKKALMATTLLAAIASPAVAESRSFDSIDANNDGELSFEELAEVFGEDGANRILARSDTDSSGSVSRDEVRVSNAEDDEEDDDESDEGDESDEYDGAESDEGDESDESDEDDSAESDESSDDSDESGSDESDDSDESDE